MFSLFPTQVNVQNIWLWPFLTLAMRELFPEPVMTECGPFFKWGFANSNTFTNQVQSGDSSHSCPEWSPDSMKNTTGLHSIWPCFFILLKGMSNDNHCQPVSQITRNYPQSQCYQDGRFLIYFVLLLMHNKTQYLSFLQTIWLMEEMLLKFNTSVGGVARHSGGHDQSSKWTWSDRQMNRELVREMNRWISKRVFNVPTVTFRKEVTNARWVLSAKQQCGRGRFRDESGTTLF